VLKPGGIFVTLAPTLGVLREGHCGIPLSQHLQRWPRLQYAYLLGARCLGLGLWKQGRSRRKWARDLTTYMQDCTSYRTAHALCAAQARHIGPVERVEPAMAVHRLAGRPRLARLARAVEPVTREAVTRLANMVSVATKLQALPPAAAAPPERPRTGFAATSIG
jgi:hypothetical protein